jgi:SAM-dependent methyltransferase
MGKRDRRDKPRTERYHDRVAAKYDAIYEGGAYWEFYDAVTWEHLRPHLPRDLASPCLDLGCGTGKWGLKLARSGFPVTMVDISARMLDRAREASEELPESKRPALVKADLADLSALPRDHFAFATAQGDPISHCENPARAIKEIAAVLRPGGVLVASVDHRAGGLSHYLERADVEGLEDFARTGLTHWLTADSAEQFPVKMFWADEIRSMLERAGFEVTDLIGKTVLDLRRHHKLLAAAEADPALMRRLLKLEARLHRDPSCLGLCGHLQVVARKRGGGETGADEATKVKSQGGGEPPHSEVHSSPAETASSADSPS